MKARHGVMTAMIVTVFIVLSSAGIRSEGSNPPRGKKGIQVVEDIEVVVPSGGGRERSGFILGIPRHRWMSISGPVIWVMMASAIMVRQMRIKGQARRLNQIHKVLGYSALGLGTLHGFLGLFS